MNNRELPEIISAYMIEEISIGKYLYGIGDIQKHFQDYFYRLSYSYRNFGIYG